jgi:hypothetical protein
LPPKIFREFRVAVGPPSRPHGMGSIARNCQLARFHKIPFAERHWRSYGFWDEYLDQNVVSAQFYDESPKWLQAIADEINNECDWDLKE